MIIQDGAHSSVIDARASLALYRIREKEWENYIKQKFANQYSNAKQKMEQDLSKINGFFGNTTTPVNNVEDENDDAPIERPEKGKNNPEYRRTKDKKNKKKRIRGDALN